MRKLLLLALLLYNIVAFATRSGNYDYDDRDVDSNKRHSLIDDRRNWRKKMLIGPGDMDHKDYDTRKRHDYDNPRYFDEPETKLFGGIERQRETDLAGYRKRFDDIDKMGAMKSGEHASPYNIDEKKTPITMNCDRQHERYESCFAGCAAISCDNPRDRLRPCYPFCEPGCVCVPPYVRDDRTHKCVLADECTKGLKGIPDLGDDMI
ncbi:uncharacterized protein LOC114358816 [Ostrinia furnacalis]|uniref:uncharacterized protein LOC114358816 n=1 Tax=Ostrinia furnacalis TaxID=93504 RepID=UPI00103F9A5A|nr:uncharacterized protein LOC114358816 [Ostrinia furnacalis]